MKPGRELDEMVAKARGWEFRSYGNGGGEWTHNGNKVAFGGYNGGSLPHVSTDIAKAMELVEELRRGGDGKAAANITIGISDAIGEPDCSCTISAPDLADVKSVAYMLPHAICLAYLKAKGVEGAGMNYDVLAVDINTSAVMVVAKYKSLANAEAIVYMCIARRGVDECFYVEVPAGTFKDGDTYKVKE